MINIKRVFQKTFDSINWIELILVILNSGIGLAITDYLGYEINWVISAYFILWASFLYLGTSFIWLNPKINFRGKDLAFHRLMMGVFKLMAILFLGLSVIPLIQIMIVLFDNLLLIYLISILCSWSVLRKYLEQMILIFGLSESISAFMICFIIPLILLNINGIQNHEVLLPISFFSFLQVIAFKLFNNIFELDKEIKKSEFISTYIGTYSILRIISGLLIFGYFVYIYQLFIQDRMKLIFPLWLTLPIAIFFVLKIFRISGKHKKETATLIPLARILILFVEIALIIGLLQN